MLARLIATKHKRCMLIFIILQRTMGKCHVFLLNNNISSRKYFRLMAKPSRMRYFIVKESAVFGNMSYH
jgi:hypothetical protein